MPTSQSLFDTLAGGFGHGVDRPGLESFVANSQSINGLRTAQTEEALNNAQQQREESDARAKLEQTIAGTLGPDGNPMFTSSQAHMAAQAFIAQHGGKVADGINALTDMQKAHNTMVLSDPNNLGTPASTAAVAGIKGALPETQEVKPEYAVPPGLPDPVVHQTPLGASETAEHNAAAGLKQHQAAAPAAGALDDDAVYNAAVKYNGGYGLPALGMGPSAAADRRNILTFAAHMSADPNWHPPSWDNPQQPPTGTSPPPGAPHPNPTGTTAHPTLQNATDAAAAGTDVKAQSATLADMTKRTSIADASEQTAIKNLGLAREMLNKADQSGSPLANTIQNKIRQGLFGDPDVSAYQNAISTARNEYARVISMATGAQGITDYAMREGQRLFPDDLAPAQFESNFAVAQREMANRTGSMHDQISNAKKNLHTPPGGSTGTSTPTPTPTPNGPLVFPNEAAAEAAEAAGALKKGMRVIVGGAPGTWQ